MMNNNNKMETLKANGCDITKYFTLVVNDTISAGTKFNVEVVMGNDPIASQIVEDGYVRNSKLHRRFITAHYLRLLNHPDGWHRAMNMHYSYMYTLDMMTQEVYVLSKLEKKDRETFNERKQFFTFGVINSVLDKYVSDVRKYINTLTIQRCKGRPYVTIKGIGYVFCDEVERKVITPIEVLVDICKNSYTYESLYTSLIALKKVRVKLPHDTKKCVAWVNAFQRAGAYYTMKNLIMYHDVKLFYNGNFYDKYNGMALLAKLTTKQEGYQLNAMLKATIKMNDFDFKKSIEAHK